MGGQFLSMSNSWVDSGRPVRQTLKKNSFSGTISQTESLFLKNKQIPPLSHTPCSSVLLYYYWTGYQPAYENIKIAHQVATTSMLGWQSCIKPSHCKMDIGKMSQNVPEHAY